MTTVNTVSFDRFPQFIITYERLSAMLRVARIMQCKELFPMDNGPAWENPLVDAERRAAESRNEAVRRIREYRVWASEKVADLDRLLGEAREELIATQWTLKQERQWRGQADAAQNSAESREENSLTVAPWDEAGESNAPLVNRGTSDSSE
jgi:hypothetical protein